MATFYVVRHAKAGSRGHWTGDDRLRPLSKKGVKQAEELVSSLESFPMTAIFSSLFLRCVQTVEPLARARGMEVDKTQELAEGHGVEGLMKFWRNASFDHVVLSTHGDIVWELVEYLVQRRIVKAGEGGYEKGSTWLVDVEEEVPVRARFISAP